MKTALRLAVLLMAAAANRAAAEIPFTDGDMNVPAGSVETTRQVPATVEDELGGGSGEPGRAEPATRVELRPVDEVAPRATPELELFTDRG